MTALQTSGSSTTARLDAPWTMRSAIGRSSPPNRLGALVAAVVALSCTLDARVPFTTGVVLTALLPAVLVDVIDRRLPNRLVAGAATVGLLTLISEVVVTDVAFTSGDLLLGTCALAAPLLVTHIVAPTAMGFGDVKAAAVAGAALGLVDPVAGLTALAIGSAGTALVGLARQRRTVAFGPGLVGGAIFTIVLIASPFDPFNRNATDAIIPISVTTAEATEGAPR